MIEIAQMALSYYLNKHHGRNDPESAVGDRGAICRTVKRVQMIQSTKCKQNQRWNVLLNPVIFYEFENLRLLVLS